MTVRLWLVGMIAAGSAVLTGAQVGPRGFLAPGAFDVLPVLPPAPAIGDSRDEADRATFRATRKLVGTPRWEMATNDVKLSAADMLRDYSCSVGVALTPENAPRTVAFVTRAAFDTNRSSAIAKDFYKRRRPFLADPGPTCQPPEQLKGSFDYPSGHTTAGWTWATLFAEIAPDRATMILARGRAFGESRIVCGVHNASAVEAGRVTAAATLAAVHSSPNFSAELIAAREELDALRHDSSSSRPDARSCAKEAALVAERIY